jgi:hypothetical protein
VMTMIDGRAKGLCSAGFPVGCASPCVRGQVIPFPSPAASNRPAVNDVGEPCAGEPHARAEAPLLHRIRQRVCRCGVGTPDATPPKNLTQCRSFEEPSLGQGTVRPESCARCLSGPSSLAVPESVHSFPISGRAVLG